MNQKDHPMDSLFRLMRVMRRGGSYHGHHSAGYGRLIGLISRHDGASARELAEYMDIRPSSLSEMLGRLEEKGEIIRVKDETDARITRIHLSEKGKEKIQKEDDYHKARRELFLEWLTPEEQETLKAICKKLIENYENLAQQEEEERAEGAHETRHHGHGKHHRKEER